MKDANDSFERSKPPTRPYKSLLRQRQAEATRQLILEALAEQLVAEGLQDFSVADAAQRAGVSPRTIYRYFPNREALLDALGAWIDQQLGEIPFPTTPAEIADSIEIAFSRFESKATLVQALLITELGKTVRSRRRSKRHQAVAESLRSVVSHLSPDEAKAKSAVIQHLVSAAVWQNLREAYSLPGEVSGKAVAWAIRTLVANLQQEKLPE